MIERGEQMGELQDLTLVQQQEVLMEKVQHRRLTKRKIIQRALLITIGAALMGVGLEIFLVPNNVIDGGITGISIMLSYLTGIKLGVFLFILNIPFFFIGCFKR